jgi:hypothetical protein
MKSIAIILLIATASHADTMRFKLRGSSGELVESAKPCGRAVQGELWKIVFEGKIEIIDDVMRGATSSFRGNPFVGEFEFPQLSKRYTFAVSLPKSREQRTVATTVTVTYTTPAGACSEKWLGLAERW